MTKFGQERYTQLLSHYAEPLITAIADRCSKHSKSKAKADPLGRIVKTFAQPAIVEKIVRQLEEPERAALALFLRSPGIEWRWDHAIRLLVSCGIPLPYRAIKTLLADGLLLMLRRGNDPQIARFEIPDGLPIAGLPYVTLAAPLTEHLVSLDLPIAPLIGGHTATEWRRADGWDLPCRLAVLWRLASQTPIKKTQQNVLFKRDQERIGRSPFLTYPPVDCILPHENPGMLAFELAIQQGWLQAEGDELFPVGPLWKVWPADFHDLLLSCSRAIFGLETWNELGSKVPHGSFSQEMSSARFLILVLLHTLPDGEGTTIAELSERLSEIHPPFNVKNEFFGPLKTPELRMELCQNWITQFVDALLYQLTLVEISTSNFGEQIIRLSSLGRKLLGLPAVLEIPPEYPQTLLAQPNHEVIVYRQGLSSEFLSRIVAFAEPKSIGAALTFHITAESVYHALETGLTPDQIIQLLESRGGRALPPGLTASIVEWSGRRDRVSVYANAELFEFNSPEDLKDAVGRGFEGVAITDRILLVPKRSDQDVKMLRIIASRDYRFDDTKCVAPSADGVTLVVDAEKSDLMLEAELTRFSEPAGRGETDATRIFRITPESLTTAFDHGMTVNALEDWFQRRTGTSPPASVFLILQSTSGTRIVSKTLRTIRTESSLVTDGLLQHPFTAALVGERLGPTTLTIQDENLEAFQAALGKLGLSVDIE